MESQNKHLSNFWVLRAFITQLYYTIYPTGLFALTPKQAVNPSWAVDGYVSTLFCSAGGKTDISPGFWVFWAYDKFSIH